MRNVAFVVSIVLVAEFAAVFCLTNGTASNGEPLLVRAKGEWQQTQGGKGGWDATLNVHGNQLSGVMQIRGSTYSFEGDVAGQVSASSIAFTALGANGEAVSFSGVLAGWRVFGTYYKGDGEEGVWEGDWSSTAFPIRGWPVGTRVIPVRAPEFGPSAESPSLIRRQVLLQAVRSSNPISEDVSSIGTQSVIVSPNYLVNDPNDAGWKQAEPEVAVNPNDPNNIVAGAIDDFLGQGIARLAYYYSADGGSTWNIWGGIPGLTPTFAASSDPVLDFDADGRVFYTGVAFNLPPAGQFFGSSVVFVSRSLDSGQSFNAPAFVDSPSPAGSDTYDKPWLAVDRSSFSPYLGTVYVCWTRNLAIWLGRSTDHGVSFDPPVSVSDARHGVIGCTLDVATNGDVSVAWNWFNFLFTDRCINRGAGCGLDAQIQICPIPNPLPLLDFRTNSYPQLAIDNKSGGSDVRYMVWADARNDDGSCDATGDADIYFTRSADGLSWEVPRPIASAPEDEFMPSVSVDAAHVIRVIYYKRTSQLERRFNLFEIFSADGGNNWSTPTQINDGGVIFETGSPSFIGDYNGVDTGSDLVRHPVWYDSRRRNPVSSGNQGDIYTATASGC